MGEGRRGDEFFDVVVLREGNICDMLSFSLLTPAQSRRANAVSSSVRKQMEQKMCPVGVGAREAFRRRGKTKKRRLVAFENVEKKNENESENVDVDDRGFTNFDERDFLLPSLISASSLVGTSPRSVCPLPLSSREDSCKSTSCSRRELFESRRRAKERGPQRRRRKKNSTNPSNQSITMPPKPRKADNLQQKSPAEFFAENKNIAGFDNVRKWNEREEGEGDEDEKSTTHQSTK